MCLDTGIFLSREKITPPGNILERQNCRYNPCLCYTTIQMGMRHVWCMWSVYYLVNDKIGFFLTFYPP